MSTSPANSSSAKGPPKVRHAPATPIRVGRLAAITLVLSVGVSFGALLLVVPLREDLAKLGVIESFSLSGLELLVAGILLLLGARQLMPGRLASRLVLVTMGGVALACSVAVAVYTAGLNLMAPVTGEAVSAALVCLVAIVLLSLPYAFAFSRLVVVGLSSRRYWAVVLLGLAAGLVANAIWRLFCPYSNIAHQVWGHGGGVALVILFGGALLYWVDRRSLTH